MRGVGLAALLAGGLVLAACGQDDKPAPTSATSGSSSAPTAAPGDTARGKQVWLAHCVVCHNVDPGRDGAIGPAVKGASKDLLEARVLRAGYPPGYTPRRQTKVMPARPDLAASIPDLAAYLR